METNKILQFKSNSFIWLTTNQGCIYNSSNGKKLYFERDKAIDYLCNEIQKHENLCCVEIDPSILTDEVQNWIRQVESIEAGKVYSKTDFKNLKEISIYPYHNLIHDKNLMIEGKKINHRIVTHYIHAITFYINGSKYGDLELCKQTHFPIISNDELCVSKINRWISYSQNLFLQEINLVGNVFTYPRYVEIIQECKKSDTPLNIFCTLEDIVENQTKLSEIPFDNNLRLCILVRKESFNELKNSTFIVENLPYITFKILITSEAEYDEISSIFDTKNENKIEIVPIFNGRNHSFFEENIYLSKDEIDSILLSKKDIFARQSLNIHAFGSFAILPDEIVYANLNDKPIGTINDTSLGLTFKELTEGESWLRIRNQPPCNDCIYQWLCPSPSNYELVLNKSNLCHINTSSY